MRIPVSAVTRCSRLSLRFRVSVDQGQEVTPAPLPWWFERIDVISATGGRVLATFTPESLWMGAIATLDEDQLPPVLRDMNCGWEKEQFYDRADPLGAGQHTLLLPLFGQFIFDQRVYLSQLKGEHIELHITPKANVLIEGDPNHMRLDGIALMFAADSYHIPMDQKNLVDTINNRLVSHNFLEVIKCGVTAQRLDSNVKFNLDLSSVEGRMAAFGLLTITPTSVSNRDDGNRNFRSLGYNGTVDITTSAGTSLFGNGNAVDVDFLDSISIEHMQNSYFEHSKAPYMIPFCLDIGAAFTGDLSMGFRPFGTKDICAITPGSSAVNEVQRITKTAAAREGYYRIRFKGAQTDPLVFTTTVQEMADAFNALPTARRDGITATFSMGMDSAVVTNVTLINPNSGIRLTRHCRVEIVNESLGDTDSLPIAAVTTVVTPDNAGFVGSGELFDITLNVFCYKQVTIMNGEMIADFIT